MLVAFSDLWSVPARLMRLQLGFDFAQGLDEVQEQTLAEAAQSALRKYRSP
jgi:hypothetical protein